MPVIELSKLRLNPGVVVLEPLRGDSDIVRSEKKYDRHGFGRVVLECNTDYSVGDLVIYDDSSAIEFPTKMPDRLAPTIVEAIDEFKIFGYQVEKGNK